MSKLPSSSLTVVTMIGLLLIKIVNTTVCPVSDQILPCKCSNYINLIECTELYSDIRLSQIFSVISTVLKKHGVRPVYDEFKLVQTSLQRLGGNGSEDLFHGVGFRRISISRNDHLERIESNAFESSMNFTTELMIEDNPILGKDPKDNRALFEMVNRFAALNSLHLTDNGIRMVPKAAFSQRLQPALREVFLTDNRIERIENEAFDRLESLELINLDGNQISELALRSLKMEPKQSEGNSSMLRIFMRSNRISYRSFPPGIFAHLRRRTFLNLSINNITKLPQSVFQSFFKRRSILSVLRNPIKCDCDFRWLLDQRILYNSSDPKADYLLRDYQCSKDDEMGSEQIINEVDRGDFEQCPPSDPSVIECVNLAIEPEQEQKCFGNFSVNHYSNNSSFLFIILFLIVRIFHFLINQ